MKIHSSEGNAPLIDSDDIPLQVQVALDTVSNFSTWRKRLQNGSILSRDEPLTVEECRDSLLSDFDEQISCSKHCSQLWQQPSQGCTPLPRICHELLTPSSQRIILCDVLDNRVSILHRPPAEHRWICLETGKGGVGGCSQFTHETLATDIPESMDIDPVSFAKETAFYSNVPFPASCEQLALRFLPRVRDFIHSIGLTTLYLTFQALVVRIPTVSGVLYRRIPSLGLASWLKSAPECEPIRSFRHDTDREVLLSGEQHWQEDLDKTLFPGQLEPALDAYARRLRELFPNASGRLACGGWLASRMFREALSRNSFCYCLMPPERSLSLWPILLDSYAQKDQK